MFLFVSGSSDSQADVDGRPLSEEERYRLDTNLPQLVRLLEPDELCSRLLADHVIGHAQYEHIRSQVSATEKNVELVDILVRRSYAHVRKFVAALEAVGQKHVANVLIDGGGLSTTAVATKHVAP